MGIEKEISFVKLIWKMICLYMLMVTFFFVILGIVVLFYVVKIDWLLFIVMMVVCLVL